MLDKVVAEFVDGIRKERDFDAPFRALLHAENFSAIHYVHGGSEQGRDFIAQKKKGSRRVQYAFQVKKGDASVADWRDAKQQLDEIFDTPDAIHPGSDESLPVEAVLVLTGRLKDMAASVAHQYKRLVTRRNLGTFAIWDRDTLVKMLRKHLAVSTTARWEVLGNLIEQSRDGFLNLDRLEKFSERWLETGNWQSMLEYCLAREFLVREGLTLHAFHLFLGLIRKLALSCEFQSSEWEELEEVIRIELKWYADPIWSWFQAVKPDMRTHAVADVNLMEIASCGTRMLMMAEILALNLMLNRDAKTVAGTRRFFEYALSLGTVQKPLSDRYAASVLAIAVACAQLGMESEPWLRQMIVWIGDAYEKGLGLAGVHSEPSEELLRVFSPPGLQMLDPVVQSTLASAVLDSLALLGKATLLGEAAADFRMLRIASSRFHPLEWPAEGRLDGRGCKFQLDNLDSLSEGLVVTRVSDFPRNFDEHGKSWIGMALMLLLRDRWWIYSLRQMSQSKVDQTDSKASPRTPRPAKDSKKPPERAGVRSMNPK